MLNTLLQRLAGLALAVCCCISSAAPVQQTFTLTPDFGSFSGGTGSFSYDSDAAPDGNGLVGLLSFTLSIDGQTFGVGDLTDAFAAFSGSDFIGLQITIEDVLTMSPMVQGEAASFAYVGPNGGVAMGDVTFRTRGNDVPEPGAASLALLALGGVVALRRRRASAST